MLEIKRLRLLWALHARGTITAVAEAYNYSPSAVSQQLRILERDAGVPLLRRVGRTLEFTPAAEALVAETEGLLAGLERAETALHRAREEVSGTVRVAAFQSALLAIVPPAVRLLQQEHPALRVEVTHHEPGDALQETWARGFDLVIAEQYPEHARAHSHGLNRENLAWDPIRIALPERGAAAARFDRPRELRDLAELPWVMESKGAATRLWAEQICRAAGFEPDVRFETTDLHAHVRLIEAGVAVGLLPALAQAGEAPRVRLLELPDLPYRTIFTAARASRESHPALVAVRRALRTAAAGLQRDGITAHPGDEATGIAAGSP